MLNVIVLSVASYWYAECHYAEWHYAECRILSAIRLNVAMLSAVAQF